MLRFLVSLLHVDENSEFEQYYQSLLDGRRQAVPSAREARHDYQRSLEAQILPG